jgi:hypothetical protein
MNGSMLTGARVPYAVAKDRLAPKQLARLSDGARPGDVGLVQGVLAVAFALSGRFDQLTDAVGSRRGCSTLNAGLAPLRASASRTARPFAYQGSRRRSCSCSSRCCCRQHDLHDVLAARAPPMTGDRRRCTSCSRGRAAPFEDRWRGTTN